MPKLNSIELKHKRMILNWAGKAWPGLKEASKVRIWCAMYDKSEASKIEITGSLDHYHGLADSELNTIEAEILRSGVQESAASRN